MKTMTVGELIKACEANRFLLVRPQIGPPYAVNARIWPIIQRRERNPMDKRTKIISFRPCGYQEYISNKIPFQQ
jgi:hypothetical protein